MSDTYRTINTSDTSGGIGIVGVIAGAVIAFAAAMFFFSTSPKTEHIVVTPSTPAPQVVPAPQSAPAKVAPPANLAPPPAVKVQPNVAPKS